MLKRWYSILLLLLVGSVSTVIAQVGQSPYTIQGIGEVQQDLFIHQIQKGGIGLSNANPWQLNIANPALLPVNSLTVFEVGAIGERRTISNGGLSQSNGGFNLNYLAFGFPVIPSVWTTAISLTPYSNVQYNVNVRENIGGTNSLIDKSFIGSGGINQVYWSNGLAINKRLLFGLKIAYNFGSIIDETIINQISIPVSDTTAHSASFRTAYYDRLRVGDFRFRGGLAYLHPLTKTVSLNLGVTYDFATNLKSTSYTRIERRDQDDLIQASDTIRNDIDGNIRIPRTIGLGISLNRGTQWLIGADVYLTNWENYENFDGQNENLQNSMMLNIGAEWVPDFFSVTNYLSRMAYRVGFNYENTPFTINGNQINEFGINFGVSLPVSSVSSINIGMNYGQRGFAGNEVINEEFYQFTIGATFNDRWFIRRKYD